MKHLKPIVISAFITCMLLIGGNVSAQSKGGAAKSGYATMRVFDCNKGVGMGGGYLPAKIVIVYEDGSTEEVELQSYNEKNEIENLKRINETLNRLKNKGYFLISQSTTGEQGSLIIDYTFLKQQ